MLFLLLINITEDYRKNKRERSRVNRFQLLLATDKMVEIREISERIFQALNNREDKVHLNVSNRNAMPFL